MRIIFLLALLCPCFSNCQPLPLTGQVINTEMQPIAGATVVLKRTGATVITTTDGRFIFPAAGPADTLVVSAVGYITAQIPNNERGKHTVILKVKDAELDAVVIMAYGTTTRRLNTGNISSISAAEIRRQPVSNVLEAMQGRVPGLTISQTSGVTGSAFNVELRGRTSLDASLSRNDPLIVIDGIVFEPGNLPANQLSSAVENPFKVSGVSPGGLSPLHSINPQDVESIEVLKDADATAIYGSRGANGVILITTRRASGGGSALTINISSGFSRTIQGTRFLNTTEYLAMRREAYANDGAPPTNASAPDLLLWDTTRYTDFQKLLVGKTAHQTRAQASFTGGNARTSFSLSGAYASQTNVFPGSFSDKLSSFHLSATHRPESNRWRMRFSALYSSDNNRLPTTDLSKYLSLPPNLRLYAQDGALAWQDAGINYQPLGFSNPMAELVKEYRSLNKNLSASLNMDLDIFRGLTFRVNAGYNSFSSDETSINPKSSISPTSSLKASSLFANSLMSSWTTEPQLEYRLKANGSTWQLLAGATLQEKRHASMSISGTNYATDLLLRSIDAAANITASNNEALYHYTAVFGRVNYNFRNKYLANLSGRRDGSSRFGPGRQFANFGSLGAAWIFSESEWAQRLPFLTFGKLRGSYGITGNDQIGDYRFLDLWSSTTNNYQGVPGLRPSMLFNPVYQWEKNSKLEFAIETSLFKERVNVNLVWFQNRSSNQLVSYRLPNTTGFPSVVKNLPALVQNKGWEIVLNAQLVKQERFSWKTAFNVTFPSNRLISFPGLEESSYRFRYEEGQSLSVIKKAKYLGVDATTGLYAFEDLNGDGMPSTADFQLLGNLDPKWYGGWSHSLNYCRLELDAFLQFTNKTGSNYLASQYISPAGFLANQPAIVLDRWRKAGDAALVQRYGATPSSAAFSTSYNLQATDAIYSDASFIRLKNLSLSYLVAAGESSKMLQSVRFYLQGQNLLTITNYLGADPETQNFYQLPPLRTWVVGAQITF
ncbi:MAG: SusC/RagA family TonB-linked outer membrane protein [Flavisolibacter sp.]